MGLFLNILLSCLKYLPSHEAFYKMSCNATSIPETIPRLLSADPPFTVPYQSQKSMIKKIAWSIASCYTSKNLYGSMYVPFIFHLPCCSDEASMPDAHNRIEESKALVERLRLKWPQFDLDGTNNVWIVKPGAKSRGRGKNHLLSINTLSLHQFKITLKNPLNYLCQT